MKALRNQLVARWAFGVFVAALSATLPAPSAAQDYPTRPITIVVPVAPGGTTDALGRIIAQRLEERLGKPVVVDNKAGGGYIVGMQSVAKAAPDGHTLILTTRGAMTVNPSLHKNLPYDPIKDFTSIALVASFPIILVVNPALPIHSVAELLDYARQQPGKLEYASAGVGSTSHLAMELLQYQTKTEMLHVPHKGDSPAMTSLLSGVVPLGFNSLTAAMPHADAGKIRVLAIANGERSSLAPELSTVAEGGVENFDMSGWYGLAAPAGTPQAIIDSLMHEIIEMMADPEMRTLLASRGIEAIGKDAETLDELMREETLLWSEVVKTAGIRIE